MTTTEFWDDFYRNDNRWSGNPNQLLVDTVGGLAPGRALDLGCGTGADAIWLAQQGWRVTAVDIAAPALAFGTHKAAEAGVGERIVWERNDLDATFPVGLFDLVACSYLHSPVALARASILGKARTAVGPGGTLIVISHAGPPTWAPDHYHDQMPSAAEVLADLDLDNSWVVDRCTVVDQASRAPDGSPATRPDTVVHAHRPPTDSEPTRTVGSPT